MTPLPDSPWSAPDMVAGFARSPPNAVLMEYAEKELRRAAAAVAIDLGCGAGRNAVPLARLGWRVLGLDNSPPMLRAARRRAAEEGGDGRVALALAPMDRLPAPSGRFDLVVAHGIWNLARSGAEMRQAMAEAARVAAPGAALFVFTFSRQTIAPEAEPVPGESFVFTQFSGEPQCFLDAGQLVAELAAVGFAPDPRVPFRELNRPAPGARRLGGPPVIFEAAFRRT